MHAGRARKAAEYVEKLGLSDRIEIRNEDFMDSDIGDATMVYCGHYEVEGDVDALREGARHRAPGSSRSSSPSSGWCPRRRTIHSTPWSCPFRKTRDVSLWISKVLFRKATVDEMYRELDTDREYRYDKRAFRQLMKKRFPSPESEAEAILLVPVVVKYPQR